MLPNTLEVSARIANLGKNFHIPKPGFDPTTVEFGRPDYTLIDSARHYLLDRIRKGPSRKVGTKTNGNVRAQNPSLSLGHSTNSESHTQELDFDIRAEADPYVFAYYDQPEEVEFPAYDKRGKLRRKLHTPDKLVLCQDGVVAVEVKPIEEIERLKEIYPSDWKNVSSQTVYIPAAKAYAEKGIHHVVWSPPPNGKIFTENLDILFNLPIHDIDVPDPIAVKLLTELKTARCATIAQINTSCNLTDCTPLFILIRDHLVHATLSTHSLTDEHSSLVAVSDRELSLFVELSGSDFGSYIPSGLVSGPGLSVEKDFQEAFRRLAIAESNDGSRSGRRYRKAIKDGRTSGLTPLQALLPNRKARNPDDGRKRAKRPRVVLDYLRKYIKEDVDDVCKLSTKAAHDKYKTDAMLAHPEFAPVSLPTFSDAFNNRDRVKSARSRGGERAANAAKPPSDVSKRAIKATRPFQCATIDHHKPKIVCEAIRDSTDQYVASPWLSVMVDIATSYVLAVWLSFKNPSRTTCAALMRLCARAHGRWPEAIIVDRGSDFQSVYYQSLLADYRVRKYDRPVSDPRFGSEAERFFGTLKTQTLNHLPGNYVYVADNRAVSSSHKATKAQLLDLRELIAQCVQHSYWRNSYAIGTGYFSPTILMKEGLKRFPFSGRLIEINDEFMVKTAVDGKRYKIDRRSGLHIPPYHYSDPALFSTPESHVDTRSDPENPYVHYAFVNNSWIPCSASKHPGFSSASDLEKRYIVAKESVPHAIKAAQANNADVQRILGIRSTFDNCKESNSDHIKLDPLKYVPEVQDDFVDLFDNAKTSIDETLEYTS